MGLAFGALAAGAFGLGVGIGFVWGELKSHREMEFAERRKEIGRLRQAQNKIPGNVRKEVRTNDPK
jgi:hypothetical protein|tara:strand:+ start:2156 stop:2353 length:198 start_codon:yes stop_codon:yes gene_type:complete